LQNVAKNSKFLKKGWGNFFIYCNLVQTEHYATRKKIRKSLNKHID
jgi:hypothetical protein